MLGNLDVGSNLGFSLKGRNFCLVCKQGSKHKLRIDKDRQGRQRYLGIGKVDKDRQG